MPFITVMQGRMVPPEGGHMRFFPRERWRDEFALAKSAGLNGIEWIYDLYGEAVNPLATDSGIAEMRSLSAQAGIEVRSLCANYFMDRPFLRNPAAEAAAWIQRMRWLLARCRTAGILRLVIPLLDESRIETEDEKLEVMAMVRAFLPIAEEFNIALDLETTLSPRSLRSFLNQCPHPLLNVTFDSGNSASCGYIAQEEFAAYGCRIGSVHIKDRRRGGVSVPLGTGDADLPAVFAGLEAMGYQGDYVMEIARPSQGGELAWIKHYRSWIAGQIDATKGVSL